MCLCKVVCVMLSFFEVWIMLLFLVFSMCMIILCLRWLRMDLLFIESFLCKKFSVCLIVSVGFVGVIVLIV